MTAIIVTLALAIPAALVWWWVWSLGEWYSTDRVCRRCHVVLGELTEGEVVTRQVVCAECRELDARAAALRRGAV